MNELSKYLVESILTEDKTDIKDVIVVYVGRFQPMHKGHYAVYEHLTKKFGKKNVFVGSSDKTDSQKSPFNFKEKQEIANTMFGIPKNRFVKVKSPYAPTEVLKQYDPKTTAFITVVGEKDKSRLSGKYFEKYDGEPTEGYDVRGYVYTVPILGKGVSGTEARNGLKLGSEDQRKDFFKDRVYGKYNEKIFRMITDKLQEGIEIPKEVIEDFLINEVTYINPGAVDDGPIAWFPNLDVFNQINVDRATRIGYDVVNMVLNKDLEDYYEHPIYPDGPVNAVSFFPAGVIGAKTATNQVDIYNSTAYNKWLKHATRKYALIGYELVNTTLSRADNKDDKQSSGDTAKANKDIQDEFEESINEVVQKLHENIKIPVKVGDTILTGRFKNKKVVVKNIGKDEHGMPTINGKKVVNFRLMKEGKLVELAGTSVDCQRCDHSWEIEGNDPHPYLCHNCGFDNQKMEYDHDEWNKWKEKEGITEQIKGQERIDFYQTYYQNLSPSEFDVRKTKEGIQIILPSKDINEDIDTEDKGDDPFVVDLEDLTINNTNYRTTKWTGKHLQMTLMSIDDEIGMEIHPDTDQFLRVESGEGKVMMGRTKDDLSFQKEIQDDFAIFVPSGWYHNIVNTGEEPLKLYAIYAPPHHKKGALKEIGNCDKRHENETQQQYRERCFGYNPLTPPPGMSETQIREFVSDCEQRRENENYMEYCDRCWPYNPNIPLPISENMMSPSTKMKDYEKKLIASLSKFMQDRLGFSAKIIIKKKNSKSLFGDLVLSPAAMSGKITLHYNPNQGWGETLKSLVHELIHAKQVVKGELKPSKDWKSVIWGGKEYTVRYLNKLVKDRDIKSYKNLPWEKEAYSGMNKYYKMFMNSKYWDNLVGEDPNLDYILSNLNEGLLTEKKKWIFYDNPGAIVDEFNAKNLKQALDYIKRSYKYSKDQIYVAKNRKSIPKDIIRQRKTPILFPVTPIRNLFFAHNEIDEVGIGTGQSGVRMGYPSKDDLKKRMKDVETQRKKTDSNKEYQYQPINEGQLEDLGITDFKSLFKKMPSDLQKRVYNLKNVGQRKDNHPEGNVLKHTITVVNRSLKDDDIDIAIAAMFHDIGKDETMGVHPKKGHITHFGHEKVSASLVSKYKKWIQSVGGNPANVLYIVKNHMRYKQLSNMRPGKQQKLKSFRAFDKLDKFSKHDRGGLGEGILTEGGAYGHMAHPFDTDINLTFGDLKDIVNRALDGNLETTTEKLDGQALAISYRKDRGLIAARNKSHLKNSGAGALDINGVSDKFKGRGGLTDAYNFAMRDLSKAINSLSDKQKEKIFQEGKSFMNLEVIFPTSVNVIPYGEAFLVFHGTMQYDDDGNAIGENKEAARILAGMIQQVNQDVQDAYTIKGPPVVELPKRQDLSNKKGKYNKMISKLQKEFGLKDTDGVAEYHQAWWENYVDKKSPSTLDNKTKMGLVKRWAFNIKKFRLDNKNISDEKVLEWAKTTEKENLKKIQKDNLMKFENIFLGVGAEVLQFTSSALAANPDEAVRDMKKRIDQTIKDVKKSGDPKKVEKLKLELKRLQSIGGEKRIVPIEGLVFQYKGKTMKLTGSFASVNQLLGIFFG